jgi:hypothetical protein
LITLFFSDFEQPLNMHPNFGGEFDNDLLQLWDVIPSHDSNDLNSFFEDPVYSSDENYLPSVPSVDSSPPKEENAVQSANFISSANNRQLLPIRAAVLKKLSFSSNDSSDSSSGFGSEESFVPSTPKKRTKPKKCSKISPIKKVAVTKIQRGRGRPKKEDDEGDDDKLIHKRKYARAYRAQHQQTYKQLSNCVMDLYKMLNDNGINIKQKFPQHFKVIQKLTGKMPATKPTTIKAKTKACKTRRRR